MTTPLVTRKIRVELVPETCMWSNVRSNVTRREWEVCKAFVRERSGSRCEICGGVGRRWPVECHEIWDYDDDNQVQTLVGLIALCPPCHEATHFGRAELLGNEQRAFAQIMRVNGWTSEHTQQYIDVQYKIWHLRSQVPWRLNIDYLATLGLSAEVRDR